METCYDEVKYWDGVYEGIKIYNDNGWKRREQIRILCGYDFEDKKILELGMGNCSLAMAIKHISMFSKYQGIDISNKSVEFAKKHKINAIQGDIRDIPLQDTYDYIIAFDVLEHIPPSDRLTVYNEINRLLSKDGLILLHRSLMQSLHDENYDHPYDIQDMAELCSVINGDIVTVKTYFVTIYEKNNVYQFAALARKSK